MSTVAAAFTVGLLSSLHILFGLNGGLSKFDTIHHLKWGLVEMILLNLGEGGVKNYANNDDVINVWSHS